MQSNLIKLSAGKKSYWGHLWPVSCQTIGSKTHAALGSGSTCVFLSHAGWPAPVYACQTLQNESPLKENHFTLVK